MVLSPSLETIGLAALTRLLWYKQTMNLIRNLITHLAFPLHFIGAQIVALTWIRQGGSPGIILATITVVSAAVILILEQINPFHETWNDPRNDVSTDALHALISQILLPKFAETTLQVILVGAAASLAATAGGSIWPHDWHLFAQLGLALVVGQFFEYWVHRLMHEVPLLWRLHATHHSPSRLYWLNAARFHPLDTALNLLAALTPILLLGAPAEMMTLLGVWIAVHGMYQHSNIRLRLGPLNYIFSMAELHRWHHSLVLEEANANYGNNIILWDLIFGTFFYPRDREPTDQIGLSDMPDFPQDYLGQLRSPFRWPEAAQDMDEPPQN
jgi:sterol desaturase/sphingolipid hydroxylase (fatty acid hydroxylase superfamily)